MGRDRITQLRVRGLRCVSDATIDLRGLTVLIGDNGTGKTTLLEAIELLRQAAKPINFVQDVLVAKHGPLREMLSWSQQQLTLGVVIEGGGPRLDYSFSIGLSGSSGAVFREALEVHADPGKAAPLHALRREGNDASYFDQNIGKLVALPAELTPLALAAPNFGMLAQPAFLRLSRALDQIDHQVSFETRPVWQQEELGIRENPRVPSLVRPVSKLERYGINLPSCFQVLRNRPSWERLKERARLGLGSDLRDFMLTPQGRGQIDVEVLFGRAPNNPVPVRGLSEGQLAYLLFLALVELDEERSLLAFDEPETHLHPELLGRVVYLLEEAAREYPVVVATHSDRMLDALERPAESVVLCDLDERGRTVLKRPNAEVLEPWLQKYSGIGSLRTAGYQQHVFMPSDPPQAPERSEP